MGIVSEPVVVFDMTPLVTKSRFRGIGTYTYELGQAMAEQAPDDFHLRFLVGAPGSYALWSAEEAFDRDALLAACGGAETTDYTRYYWQKRRYARRYLEAERVAVVHAPDPKGTGTSRHYRTLVTAHDIIPTVLGSPYRWYPKPVSVAIDRARYRPHTHVISISAWTANELQGLLGVPKDAITVIHHGVDHELFHTADASQTEETYFLYVGGFDSRKQVVPLVEAYARIASEVPENLLIVGQPSPAQRAELERVIEAGGVTTRVRILGYVDDKGLAQLYRGATAHVLPTLYEGFGMTALEAMASGCPVVTLRASCVPEICGEAALYADPGDWNEFLGAMKRLSSDEGCRQNVRERGLERAAQFTWRRAAEQTLAVYRRVLNR